MVYIFPWRICLLIPFLWSLASAQQPSSWTSQDKLALTYLFYWYNAETGFHFGDGPGSKLTLHPPDSYLSTYSFTEEVFFQRELSDMTAAGIDVALPVYWGNPTNVSIWSVPGLQMLSRAEQAMAQAGQKAPKVGMFADITSLQVSNGGVKPDLTTAAGKSLFYGQIHTFFSNVPQRFWAMIDGRPIIVLYLSAFVSAYDQTTFDYVSQQFQQDFGTTPYIIRNLSWVGVRTDAVSSWGPWYSAEFFGDVASVGPGFDNFAVAAAEARHIVIDRNCGDHYVRQWDQVVSHGARLVFVETWNELHEGSGISATKEYGRRFIDLTNENVARWKSTATPSAPAPSMAWASLGPEMYTSSLYPATNYGAGAWLTTQIAGHGAIYVDRSGTPPAGSIFLDVDDGFLPMRPAVAWITVEYLDTGSSPWSLVYDGASNAHTVIGSVTSQDTGLWKQQTFYLPDAVFQKRMFGQFDLSIVDNNAQGALHYFNRVWITRSPPSGQPPQMPVLPDTTVRADDSSDVPLTILSSSGKPLPLSLATAPGFASIAGPAGAQVVHLAPAMADVRSCADVVGPGVTSSPAYFVTAVANDPGSVPSSGATTFQVTASVIPSFGGDSVVNGASFVSGGLVPGSIATLFGSDLTTASGINLAPSLPLATQLFNVSVLVNGSPAPLFAVDNINGQQQINFQVPWELTGQASATLQVENNGFLSAPVNVPVQAAQPGIFAYTAGGNTFGAILHANYQLADAAHAAAENETVLIFCTGLGSVTPAQQDGVAATSAANTTATVTATIGGKTAQVSYSGLAPGFAGLYQVNAVVPMGLTSGNQPVVIAAGRTSSKAVLLPVQ